MTNIKVATIALLLVASVYIGIASAVPMEEWNKKFVEGVDIVSVSQTFDGGYILVGKPSSFDILLIKTNSLGNKQWSKTFDQTDIDTATSVRQTSDRGYIISGYTISSTGGDNKGWLIKTDSLGNKQWSKTFGGTGDGELFSVIQSKDGGYITTGYFGTYPNYDMWLVKTNSLGIRQWSKTFGGPDLDIAKDVKQTKDGGYIISGGINYDPTLVKTDSSGNKQWSKTFSDTGISYAESVQQTKDGGYVIAGDQNSYYAHLIKTDSSGNKRWSKTYRVGYGGLLANYAYSVRQADDEGYIIGGITHYDDYVSEWNKGLLIRTDPLGNKRWSMELGDEIKSVQLTEDNGYIVAGNLQSHAWLAKLGSESPTNLLKNPGFETSSGLIPSFWSKFQTGTKAIFTYPEIGRTGGKSVATKYVSKETGRVALWQQSEMVISPSKQYKLSGCMKLGGVTGGGTGRLNGASLRVNWYKSDGSLIRVDLITKSGTSGWTKYEKTFTSPPNAAKATVGGDLFNAAGKVEFDDLSFVKIS